MKDDSVYLRHILDAIDRIRGYTAGVSYDQFLQDNLLQDGVIRQLEIIGEASKNVSSAFRDAHPEILWKQMAGARDKLVHDYFEVDLSIVWDTVRSDLPHLRRQLTRLLAMLEEK